MRRAASHAIDRELIIKKLFNGEARRLDGPVGSTPSVCYAGGVKGAYAYDPALSKKLLAEAGYEDGGPEIELLTSNNRFIADKLVAEVIAQMLDQGRLQGEAASARICQALEPGAAGQGADLLLQPWFGFRADRTRWRNISRPAAARASAIQTRNSTNLIARVRQEFDETKRCALLNEAAAVVVDDAPVVHLWTHALVSGVRKDVTYPANAERRGLAHGRPHVIMRL